MSRSQTKLKQVFQRLMVFGVPDTYRFGDVLSKK